MSAVSQQNQSKRQREWVYLCHYLAITGLEPVHIISGQDDGLEPDFTLVFDQQHKPSSRLYYVGIELTTLPRLRDQMGDQGLIAKRWYWQGLQVMAKQRPPLALQQDSLSHFQTPMMTLYMPADEFEQHLQHLPHSPITQVDVDAVMQKKAHKVLTYQTRRVLDELWLLVHTDKYQPDCILTAPKATSKSRQMLMHSSGFDNVQITRYPSHKLIQVVKIADNC